MPCLSDTVDLSQKQLMMSDTKPVSLLLVAHTSDRPFVCVSVQNGAKRIFQVGAAHFSSSSAHLRPSVGKPRGFKVRAVRWVMPSAGSSLNNDLIKSFHCGPVGLQDLNWAARAPSELRDSWKQLITNLGWVHGLVYTLTTCSLLPVDE